MNECYSFVIFNVQFKKLLKTVTKTRSCFSETLSKDIAVESLYRCTHTTQPKGPSHTRNRKKNLNWLAIVVAKSLAIKPTQSTNISSVFIECSAFCIYFLTLSFENKIQYTKHLYHKWLHKCVSRHGIIFLWENQITN